MRPIANITASYLALLSTFAKADAGTPDNPVVPIADPSVVLAKAKLLAESADGRLKVYSIDTSKTLTLLFQKDGKITVLFENDRNQRRSE